MTKIIDLLNDVSGNTFFSLEYFPPKTEQGDEKLRQKWSRVSTLSPLFVDMTWGAGGTTSDKTVALCRQGQQEHGLEMNMHLTCTNMPADKVDTALQAAIDMGVRNIVALRGDAPKNVENWVACEDGFSCALDLVRHIRAKHGDHFGISVAGYPEGHPSVIKPLEVSEDELTETEKHRVVELAEEDGTVKKYVCRDDDFAKEIAYLKQKVDAGADFIITQLFYDIAVYVDFVRQCREAGIECPILPGVMPILSKGGFARMTRFCKTRVPVVLPLSFCFNWNNTVSYLQ
ncbi:MAG: hypothetical protein MHM6MM_004353 [Cercozoa sp. M6MM]